MTHRWQGAHLVQTLFLNTVHSPTKGTLLAKRGTPGPGPHSMSVKAGVVPGRKGLLKHQ